jgi:TolA-binding protein
VQENLQILEKAGKKKPADEALYNLGLIYAHIDNPAKDFKKSQTYFHLLIEQFPDSKLAEEGRIWLGLFETIEKIQQIDVDIEQQKKQLSR